MRILNKLVKFINPVNMVKDVSTVANYGKLYRNTKAYKSVANKLNKYTNLAQTKIPNYTKKENHGITFLKRLGSSLKRAYYNNRLQKLNDNLEHKNKEIKKLKENYSSAALRTIARGGLGYGGYTLYKNNKERSY